MRYGRSSLQNRTSYLCVEFKQETNFDLSNHCYLSEISQTRPSLVASPKSKRIEMVLAWEMERRQCHSHQTHPQRLQTTPVVLQSLNHRHMIWRRHQLLLYHLKTTVNQKDICDHGFFLASCNVELTVPVAADIRLIPHFFFFFNF